MYLLLLPRCNVVDKGFTVTSVQGNVLPGLKKQELETIHEYTAEDEAKGERGKGQFEKKKFSTRINPTQEKMLGTIKLQDFILLTQILLHRHLPLHPNVDKKSEFLVYLRLYGNHTSLSHVLICPLRKNFPFFFELSGQYLCRGGKVRLQGFLTSSLAINRQVFFAKGYTHVFASPVCDLIT